MWKAICCTVILGVSQAYAGEIVEQRNVEPGVTATVEVTPPFNWAKRIDANGVKFDSPFAGCGMVINPINYERVNSNSLATAFTQIWNVHVLNNPNMRVIQQYRPEFGQNPAGTSYRSARAVLQSVAGGPRQLWMAYLGGGNAGGRVSGLYSCELGVSEQTSAAAALAFSSLTITVNQQNPSTPSTGLPSPNLQQRWQRDRAASDYMNHMR